MSSAAPDDTTAPLVLRPVARDNWRAVAELKVAPDQYKFVAEPSYYLALCAIEQLWQPLAMYVAEDVVGFLMWAIDPSDGSCWLGGILVDQRYQRRGLGRRAIQAALTMLAEQHGHRNFALSYQPSNIVAKTLYQSLGFVETGEWEDEEAVARLLLHPETL